jgi:hypothetical protein
VWFFDLAMVTLQLGYSNRQTILPKIKVNRKDGMGIAGCEKQCVPEVNHFMYS